MSGPEPFPQLAAQRHAVLDGMYARLGQGGVSIAEFYRLGVTPDERLAWATTMAVDVYGLSENSAFNLVRNVLRVFGLMDGPHPGQWTAAAGGES